jgi:hypothetical protein
MTKVRAPVMPHGILKRIFDFGITSGDPEECRKTS